MVNKTARFWNNIADRYSKRPVADEAVYKRKLQATQNYLRPDMEVLEIGCGTGSTAIVHAPYVKHIHAIDISPRMIEIARSKTESNHIDNISFECLSVDELVFENGSVDAVLALNILHLVEDRNAVIYRIHSLIKPGGIFVSSTSCIGDSMKLFKLVAPIGQFLGVFPLVRVFTASDLVTSIGNAGFEIVFQWQPGKAKPVFIIARKAL